MPINVPICIDPLQKFRNSNPQSLIMSLGVLPFWVMEGVAQGESAKDALINRYQYYSGPMTHGEIKPNGIYQYPGDEPLPPVGALHLENETVYFYQYAIVAVVNVETGEQWITRMD